MVFNPSLSDPPKKVEANKFPPLVLNLETKISDPSGKLTPIPDGENPGPPLKFG